MACKGNFGGSWIQTTKIVAKLEGSRQVVAIPTVEYLTNRVTTPRSCTPTISPGVSACLSSYSIGDSRGGSVSTLVTMATQGGGADGSAAAAK